MNRIVLAATIAAMALGWQGRAIAQDRSTQARLNYEALLSGGRQVSDLSPQELADVIEFDRRVRAQKPDNRTVSQRCIDTEIEREGGAVSELHRRAIDMKCREAGD